MRAFWRFLLRKNLPATSLSGVSFAAFGLGDSGEKLCNDIICCSQPDFTFGRVAAMMSYLILSEIVLARHMACHVLSGWGLMLRRMPEPPPCRMHTCDHLNTP